MTKLPPDVRQRVERVKAKVKLRDLLPNLRAQGSVDCPLCKRPQKFSVAYGKCWSVHCKWNRGVDVIDIYRFKHNLTGKGSFFIALDRLEELAGIDTQEYAKRASVLEKAQEVYCNALHYLPEEHKVKQYLKSRGWSLETLYALGVGYAPHTRVLREGQLDISELMEAELVDKSYCEHFGDRIIFPIRDINGHLVKLTGRALSPCRDKWKHTKGPMTYLIGEDRIPTYSGDRVYLCEGYPDTLTLWQEGLQAVGTCGLSGLLNQASKLKDFKEVVAVYDIDVHPEGTELAGEYKSWGQVIPQLIELQYLLTDTVIYIWFLPGEGLSGSGKLYSAKDVNEFVLGCGKKGRELTECIDSQKVDLVTYCINKWGGDLGYHLRLLRLCQSTNRGVELIQARIPLGMTQVEYAMAVLGS